MIRSKIIFGISKWLLLIAYLVASLSFAWDASQNLVCKRVDVNIEDSLTNAFITKRDIIRVIESKGRSPIGKNLNEINTHELEQKIASFNTVRNVETYKTAKGNVSVRVTQRKPIARVINRQGQNYYFDDEGKIFLWSSSYTSHVLVINGNIKEPFKITNEVNVSEWKTENDSVSSPFIYQLYEFAKFITNNSFWNAQIAQVYVDNTNDIELIPRVGGHTILLGGLNDYEVKLKKLSLFYEKALPSEGWNKYKTINLKYSNQVICTKR
jgi:cell division protein FtsQ